MSTAFSALVLLRIIGAGTSFLVVALMGRVLGADGLGAYAFAMSWLGVAQLLTTFGLHHYAVRALPVMLVEQDYGAIRGFVSIALLSCTVLTICLTLLAPWIIQAVRFSPLSSLQATLLAAVILLGPFTLSQLRSGLLRGFGKPIQGMLPELILFPGLQLIALSILWLVGYSIQVLTVIYVTFGSAIIVLIVGAWPLFLRLRLLPAAGLRITPRKWLVEGGKSSILFAVGTLMGLTDIIMLGVLSTAEETGIYTVAGRFFLLMQIPALAASGAVSHLVAEYVASKRHAELSGLLGATATKTTLLAFATAVLVTGPAFAAGLIFGPQFASATTPILVMTWFRVAEAFFGHPTSFLANGGYIGLSSIIISGGVVLNIGLNILLIPTFDALGAAIATSLAHFGTTLVTAWALWRVIEIGCLPSFFQRKICDRTSPN